MLTSVSLFGQESAKRETDRWAWCKVTSQHEVLSIDSLLGFLSSKKEKKKKHLIASSSSLTYHGLGQKKGEKKQ